MLNKVYDDDSDPELAPRGPFTSKKAVLQVTIRTPLEKTPGNIIALAYGFLPFIIPAAFFINWAITRHFITLYGFMVSIITSLVNEVVFKPIVNDPRPVESANKIRDPETGKMKMKPGMPSGHVLNAVTILVWASLEVAVRGPGIKHPITCAEWMIAIFVLMAPVPWARWRNKDHSLNQCLVAGALGIVAGITAYFIRVHFFRHVGPTATGFFKHPNYIVQHTTVAPDATTIATTIVSTTLSELPLINETAKAVSDAFSTGFVIS